MNAVPKHWGADDNMVPVHWLDDGAGIVIECEVTSPSSSAGKTIYVFIRGDEVESLMKELRTVAIERRRTPMDAGT